MIDTAVAFGSASEATFGTVSYVAISDDGGGAKAVICGDEGLMGVTGRECAVYQRKTAAR